LAGKFDDAGNRRVWAVTFGEVGDCGNFLRSESLGGVELGWIGQKQSAEWSEAEC